MEQTKTDPGRKKKKPLRRCGIFFACLLFLFLCSFVYISKNPRARMLLSVIYFMQDTLKDPAYIAYHIDIMELCQDYFNGDISFEGKAYLNDIKNFKCSCSMDISGKRRKRLWEPYLFTIRSTLRIQSSNSPEYTFTQMDLPAAIALS